MPLRKPATSTPATSTPEDRAGVLVAQLQRLQRAVPRREQAPWPRPANRHSAKVLTSSKRRLRAAWRGGIGR